MSAHAKEVGPVSDAPDTPGAFDFQTLDQRRHEVGRDIAAAGRLLGDFLAVSLRSTGWHMARSSWASTEARDEVRGGRLFPVPSAAMSASLARDLRCRSRFEPSPRC